MKTVPLTDLAKEFLGVTEKELKEKMRGNSFNAVKDWHDKKSIIDFYKTTDVYIYGLINFCTQERIENLLFPIRKSKGLKILDFGAGIGALLFFLSKNNDVYYYDLPSKTQDFAKFVAKKMGYKINFIKKEELYKQKYDIIITADVLEHITDPLEEFKRLDKCVIKDGGMLTTGLDFSYGPNTPMHLKENLEIRDSFNKFLMEKYKVLYFYGTPAESIYYGVKK